MDYSTYSDYTYGYDSNVYSYSNAGYSSYSDYTYGYDSNVYTYSGYSYSSSYYDYSDFDITFDYSDSNVYTYTDSYSYSPSEPNAEEEIPLDSWILGPSKLDITVAKNQPFFATIYTESETTFWFSDQQGHMCYLTTNDGGKNYKVEDPFGTCFKDWKNFKLEDGILKNGPDRT